MVNPSEAVRRDLIAKAQSIGCEVLVFFAGTEFEIDDAFAGMAQQRVGGLIMSADAYLNTRRHQIISLAEHYAIPMIIPWGSDAVMQGALMSYATIGVFGRQACMPAASSRVRNLRTCRFCSRANFS